MFLLGFDLGTSSVKASLVDALTGSIVASDFFPKEEAPIKSVKPGWAEQNPEDWWTRLCQASRSVMSQAKASAAEVKAIGISYQMHGAVLVDKDGKLIRDSIIWCDSRGVPYGEKAEKEIGKLRIMPEILNLPGNFTATKLAWVKENEPQSFERIWKVMLPGDYAAWRMTGICSTTAEGISEYMLWDFRNHCPSELMLRYFGFSPDILPEIVPSFGVQGELTAEAAAEMGLKEGIPVTYRAGDQPNNAVSLNVFRSGEIASTAGTSGVVYGINDKLSCDPLSRVNNFAHVNHTAENPRIGVMVCINGTGILNSWMKRNVAPANCDYAQINELAAQAPVGSEGLSIFPFGNGAERVLQNRPADCSLRGINFNIHTRSHLLRAAQEGIVFSFMYGMEIMKEMGMKIDKIHAGNANMFLSPIFRDTLANVSGATIRLMDSDGAAGAARAAGIGAGIYASPEEAFSTLRVLKSIEPSSNPEPYLEAYALWKTRLQENIN